jgi:carbon monoxide dehydrogenase subunit G
MEFANTITIERPVQDVFEFLADFDNVPKWNYAIVETRKTSAGPVRVGATYRQIRSIPSRSEEKFEVTEFEPDGRLAIRGTLGPFEGTLTYELHPAGGGTRLIKSAHLQASGLGRLVAPIALGRIRKAVAANLEKLKELMES